MLKHIGDNSDLALIRTGKINDWKTTMTWKQSQRIRKKFIGTCQKRDGLENYWPKWDIF